MHDEARIDSLRRYKAVNNAGFDIAEAELRPCKRPDFDKTQERRHR
ncbi:MAG: hypothetical protein LBP60_01395 [Spirochaetaceae bacterium]|jgi:hypothetical protein|nr:hypothetical protein [Spirochaetaceae bacterium]